jgi:pimeloyl-ACP methyl ester carboxylesterase
MNLSLQPLSDTAGELLTLGNPPFALNELRGWKVEGDIPTMLTIWQYVENLKEIIEKNRIKRIAPLGFGIGGAIAFALATILPRSTRRIVAVDPILRLNPTQWDESISWIESHLPLGLPLRSDQGVFDARPILHRVRCPVLILQTNESKSGDFELIEKRIPNCWHADFQMSELDGYLERFENVAVRCPQ